MNNEALTELKSISDVEFHINEPLSRWTSFHCDALVKVLISPKTPEGLLEILKWARTNKLEWKKNFDIIGRGSNLLAQDEGFMGALIELSKSHKILEVLRTTPTQTVVKVGAGVANAVLLNWTRDQGLTGFEFAFGIPGSVGGGVRMNAGIPQGWFGQCIEKVWGVTLAGEKKELEVKHEDFEYRNFKPAQKLIVTEVQMRFEKASPETIEAKINQSKKNRDRQPLHLPNFGSVFKNPQGDFAARLIEASGLKGVQFGKAQISDKHANFIVNLGGAKASEVKELIGMIQKKVKNQFNIDLEPEVQWLGEA